MGIRNYLIEGVSGAGKTSVATELEQRGYQAIHGDRELAYKGDPATNEPLDPALFHEDDADISFRHRHHLWNVDRVREIVADRGQAITFFCGGSRNSQRFIDLFDEVFVLDVDWPTLRKRLEDRPEDEFGGRPAERQFVLQLHATKEDLPPGATVIDASRPLGLVVDDILARCGISSGEPAGSAL